MSAENGQLLSFSSPISEMSERQSLNKSHLLYYKNTRNYNFIYSVKASNGNLSLKATQYEHSAGAELMCLVK